MLVGLSATDPAQKPTGPSVRQPPGDEARAAPPGKGFIPLRGPQLGTPQLPSAQLPLTHLWLVTCRSWEGPGAWAPLLS